MVGGALPAPLAPRALFRLAVSRSVLSALADADLSSLSLSELCTSAIDAVLEVVKDEEVGTIVVSYIISILGSMLGSQERASSGFVCVGQVCFARLLHTLCNEDATRQHSLFHDHFRCASALPHNNNHNHNQQPITIITITRQWVGQFAEPGAIGELAQNAGLTPMLRDDSISSPEKQDVSRAPVMRVYVVNRVLLCCACLLSIHVLLRKGTNRSSVCSPWTGLCRCCRCCCRHRRK